jgi:hypothetical protein
MIVALSILGGIVLGIALIIFLGNFFTTLW